VSGPFLIDGSATVCDCLADVTLDNAVNGGDLGKLGVDARRRGTRVAMLGHHEDEDEGDHALTSYCTPTARTSNGGAAAS
jgi:hypothetical protein